MDINGTTQFAASPQQVWDALHNSAVIQSCAPGGSSVAWEANNLVVTGTVPVVNKTGTARLQVSNEQAPNHMEMSVNRGGVTARATIDLASSGGGTTLTYNAHADLSGPLAAGAMMVKPMIEGQLKQFFSCLDSKVR
jgi:carbon monoxide dehydrogenase subunit G